MAFSSSSSSSLSGDNVDPHIYRPMPGASVEICHRVLARISRSWEQFAIARLVHPAWRAMLSTMRSEIGTTAPITVASLASGDAALAQTVIVGAPDALTAHGGRLWNHIASAAGLYSTDAPCPELVDGNESDDRSTVPAPDKNGAERTSINVLVQHGTTRSNLISAGKAGWRAHLFAIPADRALECMDTASHVGLRVPHPTAYGVTGLSPVFASGARRDGNENTNDDDDDDDDNYTGHSYSSDDDDPSDGYGRDKDVSDDGSDNGDVKDTGDSNYHSCDDSDGYDDVRDKGKEKLVHVHTTRTLATARKTKAPRRARGLLDTDRTLNPLPDVIGYKVVNIAIITDEGTHYTLDDAYALLTLRFSGRLTSIYGVDNGEHVVSPSALRAESKYYADSAFVVGAQFVGEPHNILRAMIASQLGRLALPSKHDAKFCYRIGRAAYEPRAGVGTGKGCGGHGLYFYTDAKSAHNYGTTGAMLITTPLVTGRLSSARGVAIAFDEPEARLRQRAADVRRWLDKQALLRVLPPSSTVVLPEPGESELATRYRLFVNMLPDVRQGA